MARPAKDEKEKLSKKVTFRMTEQDFKDYQAKFGKWRGAQSEFFRAYVLTNTTEVIARPVASVESKRAVFLLQKASNNINQLAHRANSENMAGGLSEATFRAILRQLERLSDFLIGQAESTRR